MTLPLAGVMGLGGPEILAVLVLAIFLGAIPVAVILVIVKMVRKPAQISRYCPACGRGLIQPADTTFCSYCGSRLPA